MCFVIAFVALLGLGIRAEAASEPGGQTLEQSNPLNDSPGWFPFDPLRDPLTESPIDLRFLNEKFAGEHGFIAARDGHFVHSATGQPVRFWAVNGPPQENVDRASLRRTGRLLAKYGVNLVRRHGPVFDDDGELSQEAVKRAIAIVEEMKAEGIYTHLSIYFPLWFRPRADHPWLKGYDGKTHPFAALMFNPQFQEKYREWWKGVLTTPSATTGKPLIEEPALFGLELQNEDSFFFWTFDVKNIPDPQLRLVEKMFGDWVVKKYGSLQAAFTAWNSEKLNRDVPAEGRVAFRPLWNIFSQKTARDQDTAAFLFEVQAVLPGHHCFFASARLQGTHYAVQLVDGQPGRVWAFGEAQLCNGRFH